MAGIPKKLKAALLAATIAGGGVGGYQEMTRQSLIHLENIAYMPYRDIAGVLTVCVGHTGPDIEMRRYPDSIFHMEPSGAAIRTSPCRHRRQTGDNHNLVQQSGCRKKYCHTELRHAGSGADIPGRSCQPGTDCGTGFQSPDG